MPTSPHGVLNLQPSPLHATLILFGALKVLSVFFQCFCVLTWFPFSFQSLVVSLSYFRASFLLSLLFILYGIKPPSQFFFIFTSQSSPLTCLCLSLPWAALLSQQCFSSPPVAVFVPKSVLALASSMEFSVFELTVYVGVFQVFMKG